MNRKQSDRKRWVIDAPQDVTERVKARIREAVTSTRWRAVIKGDHSHKKTLSELVAVADFLPDTFPALTRVPIEMRALILDGYRDEGVDVPRELWELHGCPWLWEQRK